MKTLHQRIWRVAWRGRSRRQRMLVFGLLLAVMVGGGWVLLNDHYTVIPGVSFRLEKLVGSPLEKGNDFYGIFMVSNGTWRTLELPVFPHLQDGILEGAKPSFEISAISRENWQRVFVGYDFMPYTHNVKPWQKALIKIRLHRLTSTAEDHGVGAGFDISKTYKPGEFYHYPFYARVSLSGPSSGETFVSEPFLVTVGDEKTGGENLKSTSATRRRD